MPDEPEPLDELELLEPPEGDELSDFVGDEVAEEFESDEFFAGSELVEPDRESVR